MAGRCRRPQASLRTITRKIKGEGVKELKLGLGPVEAKTLRTARRLELALEITFTPTEGADSAHRDHPDRSIVITGIGHRDRSAATLELFTSSSSIRRAGGAGLKNREIAARLFMSRRTVEANLARAYGKLGIRSRAELGATMARRASGLPRS